VEQNVHVELGEVGFTGRSPTQARLPESFTASFAGLYSSAFHAAYRLLGNRQEAEDVAQEACARACLRWARLTKYGDTPRPWVVRVATNLAIDQYRRRRRALAKDNLAPVPVDALDVRRIDLHRALDRLTRRQRDVVVLRYVCDLSEADTAEALGCAPGTVKSHATRGLAALRAALGEEDAP
jgi:RNA polymerase sigma-70 factor (sigma-E family)